MRCGRMGAVLEAFALGYAIFHCRIIYPPLWGGPKGAFNFVIGINPIARLWHRTSDLQA